MVNPNDDEVFNPYPFITGIEGPDTKLFMSSTEHVARLQFYENKSQIWQLRLSVVLFLPRP
ncbi:hypothetical protein BYT27DRAFT_7187628 [Phlegmacium glaucopus]|nr:hypothetical protein BYT27DRAFT_7187628 [Phlegmacium glaucopus]